MAATNVQAFSGDVEVTKNLAVDTNTLFVDSVNNRVGIGTANPDKKLTVAGDMEIGDSDSDYHHLRIGGGNSSGFLYGAFAKYSDGIHMGYNFYNDNTTNQIPSTGGATSRITMGYGEIQLHTGGVNTEPNNDALYIISNGNVGIGTNNPGDNLSVMGVISAQNDAISTPQYLFRSGASNTNSWKMQANISDSVAGNFSIDRLDASSPKKFVIENNGNIGIGTDNPATYLHLFAKNSDPGVTEGDGVGSHNLTEYLRFTSSSDPGDINSVSVGFKLGADDNSSVTPDGRLDICANNGAGAGNGYGLTPDKTIATFIGSGRVGIGTTNPSDNLHIFETGSVGAPSNPFPAIVLQHYTAAGAPPHGDVTGDLCLNYHSWDGYRASGIRAFRGSYVNVQQSYVYLYTANGANRLMCFTNGPTVATSNFGWSNQQSWDLNMSMQAPNAVYYAARCFGWNTYSSRKLKENFEPVLDSLDKVKQLNGVYYTWKQGQGDNVTPDPDHEYDHSKEVKQQKHLGFIAEEVAEVLPWVCSYDENGEANGLDYSRLTPVLVNAVKELDIKIGKSEASSDDRLKDNEAYIRNATETLMKLKPQIYDKKENLESNVYQHEAGLIAQDIWYDAPELRFAVKPGLLSEIPVDAPIRSDDPREDPDYSKWGPNPASVDYNYLIPYTIKSIQELYTELPRHKTQVIGITPTNVDDYRGLLVSANTNEVRNGIPILSLTNKSYDKKCFGVVSFSNTHTTDNEILVDTKSCGSIWVINSNNIESGDYLTSSNVPGYAMKQNDDIMHNYTVAKSSIDCDFTPVQKTIKKVKQELTNVTYYIKTDLFEISKEQYDAMDDMYKTSIEHSFYTLSEYCKVSGKGGYDKMEYSTYNTPDPVKIPLEFISVNDWNSLESNVQNTYSAYYSNLVTTQVSLEDYSTLEEAKKSNCVFNTSTLYYYKVRTESKDLLPGYEPEVRQEYVNVLDENNQIQWEDTQQTEDLYQLRYLDVNGNITDKTNAVHTAALIGCKFC